MGWFINVFIVSDGEWSETASIGMFDGNFVLLTVLVICLSVLIGMFYPYNWTSDEELL